MNATALARHLGPDPDPALRRLHELTERIRQRAAEARARAMARGAVRGQLPLTVVSGRPPPQEGQLTLGLAIAEPSAPDRSERGEPGRRAASHQIAGADSRVRSP